MIALRRGKPHVANVFLAAGADINLQAKDGDTALMEAAANGYKDLVSALLSAGADPNLQTTSGLSGRTALMMASGNGHTHIVSTLLEHGADPNLKQKNGNTALWTAQGKERRPSLRRYWPRVLTSMRNVQTAVRL
jgi:ankyrin repeat protein